MLVEMRLRAVEKARPSAIQWSGLVLYKAKPSDNSAQTIKNADEQYIKDVLDHLSDETSTDPTKSLTEDINTYTD